MSGRRIEHPARWNGGDGWLSRPRLAPAAPAALLRGAMILPTTMRAIDPDGPGGPEVLVAVERPVPVPRAGEVLIRVAAAGVNRPDVLQRLGKYPMPPGAPSIPGLEAAGEVVALGEGAERWHLGDRVTALLIGGGYAEYATVPYELCLPWPEGLSAAEAASLPETWFTVWANLIDRGRLQAGERVLIHGGTSGIGVAALQLCALIGAEAIVTVGTEPKAAAALELGAAKAVNYREADFVAAVGEWTQGAGVDLVLDMIGGEYFARNLKCLGRGGRHVSIATQRGATAELDLRILMARELVLTGGLLRPQPVSVQGRIARALERAVWPGIASGGVRAVLDKTYPLEAAPDAHRRMEASEHIGKIVLEIAR